METSNKRFDANKITIQDKGYPYVVRTSFNNGIRGYLNEDKTFLNSGNTISFGQDTATMYYQEEPYFTGDKIKILQSKDKRFNKDNAQFFITAMSIAFSTFSWGSSSYNVKVINNTTISLPTTPDGSIDYDFMERFVCELETQRIAKLEAYLLATGLTDYILTDEEKKVLREFRSGDIKVNKTQRGGVDTLIIKPLD